MFIPRGSPISGSSGDHSLRVCIPFSICQTLEVVMKKSKSSDLRTPQDKQYDATILMTKLIAAMTVEIKNLTSEVRQQNSLIKELLAGVPLEEETVQL